MKLFILNIIRKTTATLEFLSPTLAKAWVARFFFSPRKTRQEAPDISDLKQDWLSFETYKGTQDKCRVYSAGTGPAVLLMHGWEGTARSLSDIAEALLKNGMRVILFDMPAHGQSPGRKTNLLDISHIAQTIAAKENALHAVVAHSFGAMCAGHAIKSGLKTRHFVTISAPTSIGFIVDHFCTLIGASSIGKQGLIDKIEAILQAPCETESLVENAKQFSMNGLIIHDQNDRMVPYSEAENLSAVWVDANLLKTKRLGHNRILRNAEVIRAITEELFLAESEATTPVKLVVNQ